MNQLNQLKEDERELVKLANYFKKKAATLIEEGKLSQEHEQVIVACERLTQTIFDHSSFREEVLSKRTHIESSIKDNASCPECHSNSLLKFIGISVDEKGWRFNKYKCRKCNIQFVWNRPNNPWDMISYIEHLLGEFRFRLESESSSDSEKEEANLMIDQLEGNLDVIKPIIQNSDEEFEAMQMKDAEIGSMIKNFKNYLLIQKVLLDSSN